MSRSDQHTKLSDALKMFIEKHKLQQGIDQVRVRDAWINVMGNGVNSYTRNVRLQKDVLMVSLSSSVLREELSYGKAKIVSMINEELGEDVIKDVFLR